MHQHRAAPSPVPTPAEVLAAKPPQAPPPPAEIKKPEPKKAGYKVQLAAIRSPQLAQQEWKRLRSKHTDLLGRMELSVSRADLGSKGIFFRLRIVKLFLLQAPLYDLAYLSSWGTPHTLTEPFYHARYSESKIGSP